MRSGGVTTIWPMMPGGTPRSFTMRAMVIVADFDCTVSLPSSFEAPWTPTEALELTYFSVPQQTR